MAANLCDLDYAVDTVLLDTSRDRMQRGQWKWKKESWVINSNKLQDAEKYKTFIQQDNMNTLQ